MGTTGTLTFADIDPPKETTTPTKTQKEAKSGSSAGMTDALSDGLTEGTPPAEPPPFDDLIPSIIKVADPVATMTNKSYNAGFNAARKDSSFYAVAIAECNRLITQLQAIPATSPDATRAAAVIPMLKGYASLYAGIQSAGAKAADAAVVASLYASLETHVYGLTPEVVGAKAYDRITHAFNEIGVFVDSWADVKATYGGGKTALSNGMWAAFLQTIERERQILNQYGLLDARGGNDKNTSRRRVGKESGSGMIQTTEEAQAKGEKDGGFMVAALESYGMHARNMERYKEQIYAIQERIMAGDFETMEESVEAFKAAVGGGETSNAFQVELEALASGTWSIAMAETHQKAETELLGNATKKQSTAANKLNASAKASTASAAAYVEHNKAAEETNKPGADEAWSKVMAFKSLAEGRLKAAETIINDNVPELLDAAATAHSEANAMLQNARNYASAVDTERYKVLNAGVNAVQVRADRVEGKLRQNEKARAIIEDTNKSIQQNAKARRDLQDLYNPQRMKVPGFDKAAAEATGASNVSTEVYSSLKVGLEGAVPGAPFMKLFGGFEARIGRKQEKGEKWTTEQRSHEFGVKIDLFFFEFVAKYVGSLKGAKKGSGDYPGPVETYEAITKEKASLEAAHEFDKGGYLQGLLNALNTYPSKVQSEVWNPLFALSTGVVNKTEGGQAAFNEQADASAAKMYSLWGNNENKLGFHGALNSTFGELAGFWENLIQQYMLRDGDDMAAEILKLKDAPETELQAELVSQHGDWKENSDYVVDGTRAKLDNIKVLKNDPNVTVESADSVEFSAKAGITKAVSGEVKASRTWSKKDGDGKYMDTQRYQTDSYAGVISFPNGEASVTYTTVDKTGEDTLGVEGKLIAKIPDDDDQQSAVALLSDTFGHFAKANPLSGHELLKASYKRAENFGKKWTQTYKSEAGKSLFSLSPSGHVSFGIELKWVNGKYDKCSMSLGFERKDTLEANLGAVKGSVEFARGSKVSWDL